MTVSVPGAAEKRKTKVSQNNCWALLKHMQLTKLLNHCFAYTTLASIMKRRFWILELETFHLKHNVASQWLSEKYDFNTGIEASLYLFVSSVCLGRRCIILIICCCCFSCVLYIYCCPATVIFLCLLLFSLPLQKGWIDISPCMINITVQLKQCLLK